MKNWTIRLIMLEEDDGQRDPLEPQSITECATDALVGLGLEPYLSVVGSNAGPATQLLMVDDKPVSLDDLVKSWRKEQDGLERIDKVLRGEIAIEPSAPTDEEVHEGAEVLDDLLTMLGLNPDERPEHGGLSIAETLARAVLNRVVYGNRSGS